MTTLLSIECSTDICLLCLEFQGELFSRRVQGVRSHSENILRFIDDLLKEAGIKEQQLEAIAVSSGPGSFTGVRLAASIAKTLAWVLEIPVIPLNSLAISAYSMLETETSKESEQSAAQVCVLRDAKMQEVYVGIYSKQGQKLAAEIDECLIKLTNLSDFIEQYTVSTMLIQSDLPKTLLEEFAHNVNAVDISAPTLMENSLAAYAKQNFDDGVVETALAFEPIYLRGKNGWKTLKEQNAIKKVI